MDRLAASTVTTGDDVIEAMKTVGGFAIMGYLLISAAYNAHGVFMRPGTLRRRLFRAFMAIVCVVACVYIAPVLWGPDKQ